jgi:hypothetical protein
MLFRDLKSKQDRVANIRVANATILETSKVHARFANEREEEFELALVYKTSAYLTLAFVTPLLKIRLLTCPKACTSDVQKERELVIIYIEAPKFFQYYPQKF